MPFMRVRRAQKYEIFDDLAPPSWIKLIYLYVIIENNVKSDNLSNSSEYRTQGLKLPVVPFG
jgi:hypothetical protein